MSAIAPGSLAQRLCDALQVPDAIAAEGIIDHALAHGLSATEVHCDVIQPAMAQIGELWAQGLASVADEHVATGIGQHLLAQLQPLLRAAPRRSRERVLLAAVEGQHHVLGLRMAADTLEGAGFDVLYLGADVPVHDLANFVRERRPAVTGLSCTMVAGPTQLADAILAVHEAAPATRILLGGMGVPTGLRHAGWPWIERSADVVGAVEDLLAAPPSPPPPVLRALSSR